MSQVFEEITLVGGEPSKAATPNVLIRDIAGNALFATGTTVPTDTTKGYAKGCLFIDTDVASGTTGLYCNKGTKASCIFTAITQG